MTNDLTSLDGRLQGQVVTPGGDGWDAARQAWNLAVDQNPAAVALAAGPDDVVETVRFAAANGLRVAPQGTGHAAGTLGDLSDTILLKTAGFGAVEIDGGGQRARVEAGALWGEVAVQAGEHGLAALAGSSIDVGVVGYTLGGGLGWLGRPMGLACNSVLAVEIVLASGEQVRVDADNDPDLFWALRGGGGSFGVVTALEFRLFPIAEVYGGMFMWPAAHHEALFAAYRELAANAPRELTTSFRYLRLPPIPDVPEELRGQLMITFDGAYLGPESEGEKLIRPLLDVADPIQGAWATIPAADLRSIHGDPEQPVPGRGHHTVLRELSDEATEALIGVAGPDSGSPLLSVELRHLGGALGEDQPDSGALGAIPGEFTLYGVGMVMSPEMGQAVGAHLDKVVETMAPWSTGQGYLNFADGLADPAPAFRADVYERLRSVKSRVDPDDLIRSNHPVPAAA